MSSTLGVASFQDRQFAARAKRALEQQQAHQKHILTGTVNQVFDIYALLNSSGGQQEAVNITRRAGEDLVGMGLMSSPVKPKTKIKPDELAEFVMTNSLEEKPVPVSRQWTKGYYQEEAANMSKFGDKGAAELLNQAAENPKNVT